MTNTQKLQELKAATGWTARLLASKVVLSEGRISQLINGKGPQGINAAAEDNLHALYLQHVKGEKPPVLLNETPDEYGKRVGLEVEVKPETDARLDAAARRNGTTKEKLAAEALDSLSKLFGLLMGALIAYLYFKGSTPAPSSPQPAPHQWGEISTNP